MNHPGVKLNFLYRTASLMTPGPSEGTRRWQYLSKAKLVLNVKTPIGLE